MDLSSKYESLPIESVTATDDWTVVFKLTKPYLGVLSVIFNNYDPYIYPPEVIEEHGDANGLEETWSAPVPI